eukprot:scaffold4.g4772.t1
MARCWVQLKQHEGGWFYSSEDNSRLLALRAKPQLELQEGQDVGIDLDDRGDAAEVTAKAGSAGGEAPSGPASVPLGAPAVKPGTRGDAAPDAAAEAEAPAAAGSAAAAAQAVTRPGLPLAPAQPMSGSDAVLPQAGSVQEQQQAQQLQQTEVLPQEVQQQAQQLQQPEPLEQLSPKPPAEEAATSGATEAGRGWSYSPEGSSSSEGTREEQAEQQAQREEEQAQQEEQWAQEEEQQQEEERLDGGEEQQRQQAEGEAEEEEEEQDEEEEEGQGQGDYDTQCCQCDDGGRVLGCDGPCMRAFHIGLVDQDDGSVVFDPEQCNPLHMAEDVALMLCFICKEEGEAGQPGGVHPCVAALCGKFYHAKCIGKEEGEPFVCGLHSCNKCGVQGASESKGELVPCRRCPKAYHRACLPTPTKLPRDAVAAGAAGRPRRVWLADRDASGALLPGCEVERSLMYCLRHSIGPGEMGPRHARPVLRPDLLAAWRSALAHKYDHLPSSKALLEREAEQARAGDGACVRALVTGRGVRAFGVGVRGAREGAREEEEEDVPLARRFGLGARPASARAAAPGRRAAAPAAAAEARVQKKRQQQVLESESDEEEIPLAQLRARRSAAQGAQRQPAAGAAAAAAASAPDAAGPRAPAAKRKLEAMQPAPQPEPRGAAAPPAAAEVVREAKRQRQQQHPQAAVEAAAEEAACAAETDVAHDDAEAAAVAAPAAPAGRGAAAAPPPPAGTAAAEQQSAQEQEQQQQAEAISEAQLALPPLRTIDQAAPIVDLLLAQAERRVTFDSVRAETRQPKPYRDVRKKTIDKDVLVGWERSVKYAADQWRTTGKLDAARTVLTKRSIVSIGERSNDLTTVLAPFLHRERYTSYGRHFTDVSELLRPMVDRLAVVDFSCGANHWVPMVVQRCLEDGLAVTGAAYDIIQAKEPYGFRLASWFDVPAGPGARAAAAAAGLAPGDRLVVGLNPPYGMNNSLAEQFISRAAALGPRLIALIVPPTCPDPPGYRKVYEDAWAARGERFYVPGSAHRSWNKTPPAMRILVRADALPGSDAPDADGEAWEPLPEWEARRSAAVAAVAALGPGDGGCYRTLSSCAAGAIILRSMSAPARLMPFPPGAAQERGPDGAHPAEAPDAWQAKLAALRAIPPAERHGDVAALLRSEELLAQTTDAISGWRDWAPDGSCDASLKALLKLLAAADAAPPNHEVWPRPLPLISKQRQYMNALLGPAFVLEPDGRHCIDLELHQAVFGGLGYVGTRMAAVAPHPDGLLKFIGTVGEAGRKAQGRAADLLHFSHRLKLDYLYCIHHRPEDAERGDPVGAILAKLHSTVTMVTLRPASVLTHTLIAVALIETGSLAPALVFAQLGLALAEAQGGREPYHAALLHLIRTRALAFGAGEGRPVDVAALRQAPKVSADFVAGAVAAAKRNLDRKADRLEWQQRLEAAAEAEADKKLHKHSDGEKKKKHKHKKEKEKKGKHKKERRHKKKKRWHSDSSSSSSSSGSGSERSGSDSDSEERRRRKRRHKNKRRRDSSSSDSESGSRDSEGKREKRRRTSQAVQGKERSKPGSTAHEQAAAVRRVWVAATQSPAAGSLAINLTCTMGDGQVVYLEKFVESTTSLPPDLQRILNTIKDLDERSEDLAAQIQDNVELVLGKTAARAGTAVAEEVAELRARIDVDQRLLVQFAEEKVQLAVAGYDLLDSHLAQLDIDIHDLGEELAAVGGKHCCQTVMGLRTYGALGEALGDYLGGGTDDGPTTSRRSGRMRDAPSFDSLADPSVVDGGLKRKTTVTLSLSRQVSGLDDAATPGSSAGGGGGSTRRTTPAAAAATAGTPAAPAPPPSGLAEAYQPASGRRRAASANVHAAAAAVAAMEEDDAGEVTGSAAAAGGVAPGAGAALLQPLPPLVPGLAPSATQPQAPGRLLNSADINAGLVGRVAELFWPADGNWYLIRFESVDMATRRAHILYNTGEQESLSLDDIQRDGHCSLIS